MRQRLRPAPTIDGDPLNYFGHPMPIANGDGVLKVWSTRNGSTQLAIILLEWSPAH